MLLLAACQTTTPASGAEHAVFATEPFGLPGNGDHPAADATHALEAQSARLCPGGYERTDERVKLFADGRQWVWQIRCKSPA
jgi:hypothetical protein